MKGVANPAAVLDHGGLGSGARLCDQLSACVGASRMFVGKLQMKEREINRILTLFIYLFFFIDIK